MGFGNTFYNLTSGNHSIEVFTDVNEIPIATIVNFNIETDRPAMTITTDKQIYTVNELITFSGWIEGLPELLYWEKKVIFMRITSESGSDTYDAFYPTLESIGEYSITRLPHPPLVPGLQTVVITEGSFNSEKSASTQFMIVPR